MLYADQSKSCARQMVVVSVAPFISNVIGADPVGMEIMTGMNFPTWNQNIQVRPIHATTLHANIPALGQSPT
jgi:hypothetical protein